MTLSLGGMVLSARWAGLSISKTGEYTTVCRAYTDWLDWFELMAVITQIIALYKQGEEKSIAGDIIFKLEDG